MSDIRASRDSLLESIERWDRELDAAPPRSTLGFGIAQKCYSQLDGLVAICTEECVCACGPQGDEAAKRVAEWKALSKLTLGQRVTLLVSLNAVFPPLNADVVPAPRANIMERGEVKLIQGLVKDRNLFAHDFADVDPSDLKELLARVRVFCESQLIQTVSALQQRNSKQPPRELTDP